MFGFVFLAPYARTTRYEEAFLPKGKKQPRSLRSLGLASLLPGIFVPLCARWDSNTRNLPIVAGTRITNYTTGATVQI